MVDIIMIVMVEEEEAIDHKTKIMKASIINKEDMIILSNTTNITRNMDTIKANITVENLVRLQKALFKVNVAKYMLHRISTIPRLSIQLSARRTE